MTIACDPASGIVDLQPGPHRNVLDRRPSNQLKFVLPTEDLDPMTDAQKTAVVEVNANNQPAVGSSLRLRIRQQEILAELGVLSLQGTPFSELLSQTASLTAEGLEAEFCKVLEYQRQQARFLVTAGVGWGSDVIGIATVGADIESPAGYALVTGKPVISNHLENEDRFRTPELLVRHGI